LHRLQRAAGAEPVEYEPDVWDLSLFDLSLETARRGKLTDKDETSNHAIETNHGGSLRCCAPCCANTMLTTRVEAAIVE